MGEQGERMEGDGVRVVSRKIIFSTKGNSDVVNITGLVNGAIGESGLAGGILTVFCAGATGAVTTTEYEPGCIRDIRDWFDRHVPEGDYEHQRYEHDNNGHSHGQKENGEHNIPGAGIYGYRRKQRAHGRKTQSGQYNNKGKSG